MRKATHRKGRDGKARETALARHHQVHVLAQNQTSGPCFDGSVNGGDAWPRVHALTCVHKARKDLSTCSSSKPCHGEQVIWLN
jgi:hypothetical protein